MENRVESVCIAILDKPSIEDFLENPDKYLWGSFDPSGLPENKEKSLRFVTEGQSKGKQTANE